jgi:hypothetical protein
MTKYQSSFWTTARALATIGIVLFGVLLSAGCIGGDDTYREGFIVASTENPAPGEAWAILRGDRESDDFMMAPAYKNSYGDWDYTYEHEMVIKSREFVEWFYPYKVGYAVPAVLTRRW